MILVTGATGFVGRCLVPRLVESGAQVRCLLRPARQDPRLPRDVPLQVAVASVQDYRGLRAALVGVKTVIHLASTENYPWSGKTKTANSNALLEAEGTAARNLVQAAQEVGVKQIIYLSQLGADRASAFLLYKAKGIVEEIIRSSGITYSIIRSGIIFGAEDHFTNTLATLLLAAPYFFVLPGDGEIKLHPIWVEDVATCLEWCMEDPALRNLVMPIGGPEFISIRQILETIQTQLHLPRYMLPLPIPYVRAFTERFNRSFRDSPVTSLWLDHFAVNRVCEIQSTPRYFGIRPAPLHQHIEHIRHWNWWRAWRYLRSGKFPPQIGANT